MSGSVFVSDAVFVVAEIGNNHEGNFEIAQRLVREAAAAGADAVKFQTARADRFISPADAERLARFRSYEFTPEQWARLAGHAREQRLRFLSTPLDLDSAQLLDPLVDAFKVASGDITFIPLLDFIASTGKPVILSTGASEMPEVRAAVARVRDAWEARGLKNNLAVLHCVSAYPTPPDQANLRGIATLATELGVEVGYSDHVIGIEAAVASVAAGARIVEKHFTLDKAHSTLRDHALSADPADFREMVTRIRALEAMLGSGAKRPQAAELATAQAIRRSIAASRDLPGGHVLRSDDFVWLRPGSGLQPGREHELTGRRLTRAVRSGELLSRDDVA
jgi:N,N'-diacetyllegionaminate synthase